MLDYVFYLAILIEACASSSAYTYTNWHASYASIAARDRGAFLKSMEEGNQIQLIESLFARRLDEDLHVTWGPIQDAIPFPVRLAAFNTIFQKEGQRQDVHIKQGNRAELEAAVSRADIDTAIVEVADNVRRLLSDIPLSEIYWRYYQNAQVPPTEYYRIVGYVLLRSLFTGQPLTITADDSTLGRLPIDVLYELTSLDKKVFSSRKGHDLETLNMRMSRDSQQQYTVHQTIFPVHIVENRL